MPIGDKYVALTNYLKDCRKDEVSLSVEKIANIIDLPRWVRNPDNNPWVNTSQSFSAGWRNAGYTAQFDRETQIVTFIRDLHYKALEEAGC